MGVRPRTRGRRAAFLVLAAALGAALGPGGLLRAGAEAARDGWRLAADGGTDWLSDALFGPGASPTDPAWAQPWADPARRSDATRAPLRVDRDLRFVQPANGGPHAPLAVLLEAADPALHGRAMTRLCRAPEAVAAVRLWQQLRRRLGRASEPLQICFHEHRGASFVALAPSFQLGGDLLGPRLGPTVFLSRDTCRALGEEETAGLECFLHEVAHVLMLETHGPLRYPYGLGEYLHQWETGAGHWRGKRTDPVFAFSEGFAEFFADFLLARAPDPAALYAPARAGSGRPAGPPSAGYDTDGGAGATGPARRNDERPARLDRAALLATEGAVAALLGAAARVAPRAGRVSDAPSGRAGSVSDGALGAMLETLAVARPRTLDEFFAAHARLFPADAPTTAAALDAFTGGNHRR